jgi:uncharacterized protein DUF3309
MYVNARNGVIGETTIALAIDGSHAAVCRARKLNDEARRSEMTLGMVLLIVLVLALLGVIPTWPHSRSWGYAPSGVVGLVAVVLVVMLLTGNI